ncbi:unnamed protein product [Amoebophrya sp. A120]|nr:unnamed protein product [Amoebophrya sp. A120]|eukprot:GSA120T00001836001.1
MLSSVVFLLLFQWVVLTESAEPEQYSGVAAQLVEDECEDARPQFIQPLRTLAANGLIAQEDLHLRGPETSLGSWMAALAKLLHLDPYAAFECPLIMTSHIRKAADSALYLLQKKRARVLLQIGNMFKLSAMSRWYTEVADEQQRLGLPMNTPPPTKKQRFQPRMQMDYQLGLALLTQQLLEPPVEPRKRWPAGLPKPKIDVLSICVYSPDKTSNTVLDSPLPGMTPENHKQYVAQTGLNNYVMHDKLLMPDREAHYSKFLVVYQHLQQNPGTEWVFFMDCDAFFTTFDFTVFDLLATYADPTTEAGQKVNFIVAEDTGGINTGVFLVRNTPWSFDYLQRVTLSPFTTAWDQSMFFTAAVNATLFSDLDHDFQLPPEVRFVHQKHLNAFVPPASKDWGGYEWQVGDFARHFAGCPWQEKPCLDLMYETLEHGRRQYSNVGNARTDL